MATVEGLAEFKGALKAIQRGCLEHLAKEVNAGADELVSTLKAVAPVSDLEAHPGQLRESIHKKPGGRPLQVRVVADAQDAEGHYYGAHVEFGHRTPNGKHVPAHPFFYPAWRLTRAKIKARIQRAIRAVVKAETHV